MSKYIDIVFEEKAPTGNPPDLRFVEVENGEGASVGVGQWVNREDGFTALRLTEDVVTEMRKPLYDVPFLPGDGTGETMLKVKYIASGFPRDARGLCAFCHGDPCNEDVHGNPDSLIAAYWKRNPTAETCPCCRGAPS